MDFVVIHTVAKGAATQVFGPFPTKDAAYEWAVADRAKRGFAEKHQTVGTDYLTWENDGLANNVHLDWYVVPFTRTVEDSFQHPLGVPLFAKIDEVGEDLTLVDEGGFIYGRIYDRKAPSTAALVKHITGKALEDHTPYAGNFLHVESVILQEILTGKQPVTLPLLQMAVDFTDIAASCDDKDVMLHNKDGEARQAAMEELRNAMSNLINYVELYKREPTTMIEDVLVLLRKYWTV